MPHSVAITAKYELTVKQQLLNQLMALFIALILTAAYLPEASNPQHDN